MKKLTIAALVTSSLFAANASATIMSVSSGTSSAGVSGQIIAAPGLVTDAAVTNQAQQGFDEQQLVSLAADLAVDGGTIAQGTNVASHMIFLNKATSESGVLSHIGVEWMFDGQILGVMSDSGGNLEAASNALLGAAGTIYPGAFGARGMEGSDSYTIDGDKLTVTMRVTQPGDWIRVITDVPEPASMALFGLGLMGLGFSRRRKNNA
ncbi:PEP-CTERM sorting domain-containing protein [Photobacterium sanguinicancri]|uniref:PEP-CTERM sorting domain-containing protein n=1 Tax=Photobacterium sanguinicancri TaxID=875932 RepID=UPI0026E22EB7|nr:PEP-CTERM sorting domain-containing protein [Photobacterium sanguinicancri]MDO6496672.1 PEP-CTERM sorting domain-containing protein [Photobacterium sanguinicancri]